MVKTPDRISPISRSPSGEPLSAAVLAELQTAQPALRTGRWKHAALLAFTLGARRHGLPRDFVEMVRAFNYVPDAYIVNKHERVLHFIEIEVFNPMREAKLRAYGQLAIDLASYGIEFGVFVANKYGHLNQVELLPYYKQWLKLASAGDRPPSAALTRCWQDWARRL